VTAIVGVHGVGNHHYVAASTSVASATDAISGEWADALERGLARFGGSERIGICSRV